MSSSGRPRLGGARRFALLGLTSLVAIVGFQSTISPAQAAVAPATSGAGTSSASSYTVQGCPSGYLCLYKGAAWNNYNGRPDAMFYRCRVVNLSNWVTRHGSYINNQTGGVTSKFFSGYNGTGTVLRYSRSIPHTNWYDYDFDFYPVNSIKVC